MSVSDDCVVYRWSEEAPTPAAGLSVRDERKLGLTESCLYHIYVTVLDLTEVRTVLIKNHTEQHKVRENAVTDGPDTSPFTWPIVTQVFSRKHSPRSATASEPVY